MGIIVKSDHLLSLSGRVQEAFCVSSHAFLCVSAKKRPELIPTEVTSLFVSPVHCTSAVLFLASCSSISYKMCFSFVYPLLYIYAYMLTYGTTPSILQGG